MTTKLQGSQFVKKIKFTGAGYNECDQMIAVIVNASTDVIAVIFVKVADSSFPDAKIIEQVDDDTAIIDLFFTSDMTKDLSGKYVLEVQRTVAGERMPIIKTEAELFTIKKTHIA